MVIFKNTNRRGRFRSNDRGFKRNNGDVSKFKSDFSTNSNFQRKTPGRNNHNAPKLREKYNDLAREALANGDKILSENYFQHADHFARVIEEKESKRATENSEINKTEKKNTTENQKVEKQIINN
tara:strand:+ start:1087 stop:1461 length:375 start_codon:yes stop_codon:yes gene_type:complete